MLSHMTSTKQTGPQPTNTAQTIRDAQAAADRRSPRPTYEAYGVWQVA